MTAEIGKSSKCRFPLRREADCFSSCGPSKPAPDSIHPAIPDGSDSESIKADEKKVEETAANLGKDINGWRVGASFGDRGFYNGDWLLRAAAAMAGIYINAAEEAMYLMTRTTTDCEALDASKHNYTIRFSMLHQSPCLFTNIITKFEPDSTRS